LLVNNDVDNADDVNDVNDADVNNADNADDAYDVNDADVNDADDKRRRTRSPTKEGKRSRLGTSLDRAERLVVCCFFAPLAASQAGSKNDQIKRIVLIITE
jgi:hypothetical protein